MNIDCENKISINRINCLDNLEGENFIMKRSMTIFACLLLLLSSAGCSNNKNNKEAKTVQKSDSKSTKRGNVDYYKCLSKISLDNTIEDINKIVGIKGVKDEEDGSTSDAYKYDFGNEKVMTVYLSDGKMTSAKIEYENEDLANKKVTLDHLDEIKEKINDGVTYEEFKEAVGGVEGTLIEIGSWNEYVWVVENDDGYVTADFDQDGQLKFFNGLGFN